MCRLYGFRATEPTTVECTLVRAQNALIVQSQRDQEGRSNAHGWGVAVYPNGGLPHVERQAWAAYHGEHFREAAVRAHARTVVAHVRRATMGVPALENTHPSRTDGGHSPTTARCAPSARSAAGCGRR
jgi:predicted glutamine amidotransferase